MDYTKDISLAPDICYSDGKSYQKPYENGENCTYNINWVSRKAMQTSLAPLLHGNGQFIMSNRQSWSFNTVKAVYGMEGNLTDINSMFDLLSSTLTLNARSKICKYSIQGKAWAVQSFVHVRWLWLILPGALVVLSTGFLITTIVHTRNQYIWKSSPLALLFSDLLVDTPTPPRPDPTLKGVENTSRNMEVLLETSQEGVKLKTVPTL